MPYRFLVILSAVSCFGVAAQGEPPARELSLDLLGEEAEAETGWFDSVADNARLAIDLAARVEFDDRSDEWRSVYFAGIDVHKVFSGSDGDWGTLVFQPYATRLDSPAHPPFFEDDHDWELVWRIATFNYTGLAQGRFNIKAGHIELPYGIEHDIDTNGTLLDYTHGANLGVKADWGASINGELDAFGYELALTRGTGNEWSSRGEPFLISGRIASPREEALVFGASLLHGEVQRTMLPGNTLRRTRVGVDVSWMFPLATVRAEASVGEDEDRDIVNGLVEVDWASPGESWQVYDQLLFFNTDTASGWQDAVANRLGVRFTPDQHWDFSTQWIQDVTVPSGSRSGRVQFQVRVRF